MTPLATSARKVVDMCIYVCTDKDLCVCACMCVCARTHIIPLASSARTHPPCNIGTDSSRVNTEETGTRRDAPRPLRPSLYDMLARSSVWLRIRSVCVCVHVCVCVRVCAGVLGLVSATRTKHTHTARNTPHETHTHTHTHTHTFEGGLSMDCICGTCPPPAPAPAPAPTLAAPTLAAPAPGPCVALSAVAVRAGSTSESVQCQKRPNLSKRDLVTREMQLFAQDLRLRHPRACVHKNCQ
jgi:hypothetical protein